MPSLYSYYQYLTIRADSRLESSERHVAQLAPVVPAAGESKSQEPAVPGTVYRAFSNVDLESQPLLQIPGHTRHDPFARCFASDIGIAIISITDETVAPSFQLLLPSVGVFGAG
jgi:hypothetical protein